MMVMAFNDAIGFYKNALEILRKNDDHLWISGTLEGYCAALYQKLIKIDNPLFA
jgi:hypothetical protein